MKRRAVSLLILIFLGLFMVLPSDSFAYQIFPYVSKEEPHPHTHTAPSRPAGLEAIGAPYIVGDKLRIMGAISGVSREDPPYRTDRCSVYLDPLQRRHDVHRPNVITIRANLGVREFPIFWVIPRDIPTGWYRVVITFRGQEFRSGNFEIRQASSPSEGYGTTPRGVDLTCLIKDARIKRTYGIVPDDKLEVRVEAKILGGPVRRLNNVGMKVWATYHDEHNNEILSSTKQDTITTLYDDKWTSRSFEWWFPTITAPKGTARITVVVDFNDEFGDPYPYNNRATKRLHHK